MNIKEKFTPETHQTRCGKPWRWLDVKNTLAIAVEVETDNETIFYITEDGCTYDLNYSKDADTYYDLIPIQHPPIALPTNLRSEIKWAAMDEDYVWWFYATQPTKLYERFGNQGLGLSIKNVLLHIPKDQAGWENSLHELVDGIWRRVQS